MKKASPSKVETLFPYNSLGVLEDIKPLIIKSFNDIGLIFLINKDHKLLAYMVLSKFKRLDLKIKQLIMPYVWYDHINFNSFGKTLDFIRFVILDSNYMLKYGLKRALLDKHVHYYWVNCIDYDERDEEYLKDMMKSVDIACIKQYKHDISDMLLYSLVYRNAGHFKILVRNVEYEISFKCLQWAALSNKIEIFELLLESDKVNFCEDDCLQLLRWSSINGRTNIVKLLLKYVIVDLSIIDDNFLELSSKNGKTDIVRLLLDDGRIDADKYYSSLKFSIDEGHMETTKLLLANIKEEKNIELDEALLWCCKCNKIEIAKLLLEDGRADPSFANSECLRVGYNKEYTEIINMLLKDGRARVNS